MHGNCLWISLSTRTSYTLLVFCSILFFSYHPVLWVSRIWHPSTSSSSNLLVLQRGMRTYGIYIMHIHYSSMNLSRSHPWLLHQLSHTAQIISAAACRHYKMHLWRDVLVKQQRCHTGLYGKAWQSFIFRYCYTSQERINSWTKPLALSEVTYPLCFFIAVSLSWT